MQLMQVPVARLEDDSYLAVELGFIFHAKALYDTPSLRHIYEAIQECDDIVEYRHLLALLQLDMSNCNESCIYALLPVVDNKIVQKVLKSNNWRAAKMDPRVRSTTLQITADTNQKVSGYAGLSHNPSHRVSTHIWGKGVNRRVRKMKCSKS